MPVSSNDLLCDAFFEQPSVEASSLTSGNGNMASQLQIPAGAVEQLAAASLTSQTRVARPIHLVIVLIANPAEQRLRILVPFLPRELNKDSSAQRPAGV